MCIMSSSNNNHRCSICGWFGIRNRYSMDRHREQIHDIDPLDIFPIICHQCGGSFGNRELYETHMVVQHGDGVLHQCSICPRAFTTETRLNLHNFRLHRDALRAEHGGDQAPIQDGNVSTSANLEASHQPFVGGRGGRVGNPAPGRYLPAPNLLVVHSFGAPQPNMAGAAAQQAAHQYRGPAPAFGASGAAQGAVAPNLQNMAAAAVVAMGQQPRNEPPPTNNNSNQSGSNFVVINIDYINHDN